MIDIVGKVKLQPRNNNIKAHINNNNNLGVQNNNKNNNKIV